MVKNMPGRSTTPRPGLPRWTTLGASWKFRPRPCPQKSRTTLIRCFSAWLLDGMADIAERCAGARRLDAEHQAFIGDLDELLRLQRHIANKEHAAGIAMPAIDNHRHIDVDDIAVLQLSRRRNAVADDVIDADAQAVAEAAIEDRRRIMTGGADEFIGQAIEIERHHIGNDMRRQHVEHLCCQPPGACACRQRPRHCAGEWRLPTDR